VTSINDLKSDHKNARKRTNQSAELIQESIKRYGAARSIVIDEDNRILAGNGTIEGAKAAGIKNVRIIETAGDEIIAVRRTDLTEHEKVGLALADNRTSDLSDWDSEMLHQLSQEQDISPWFDEDDLAEIIGDDPDSTSAAPDGSGNIIKQKLSDSFGVAPFTVLNAREGWWQERKKSWLALGIKSEEGRDNDLLKSLNTLAQKSDQGEQKNNSIFDPVLCELAYRWFSPQQGIILDPFAGGSVRGIVASKLNRQYIGCELREEQVLANRQQADQICQELPPVWHCMDSMNIDKVCKDVQADFIFSCPPYADLEVYSDNPKDLSTLKYQDFLLAYREIIAKSCGQLKDDAFACFVVGEVRDKKGNYYNFVGDTIQAFIDAGLSYYNEAILLTCIGAKALTAGKGMTATRKLGKVHQNVLVFLKGNARKAVERCGECSFGEVDPAEEFGEVLQ